MKTLKALFGLAVVAGGIYAAFMLLPPYFNSFQFQDAIESEARVNAYTSKPEQEIRETLAKKARELDIPLQAEQINVQRVGNEIAISADYKITVDLVGRSIVLEFHPTTKNKRM